MDYQTFRGSDVQEALLLVRQALGADALIESTRHITNGQGGAFGRSFVEVVAAPGATGAAAVARESMPSQQRLRASSGSRVHTPQTSGTFKRTLPLGDRKPATPPAPALDVSSVGRELMQLRLMLDELSQGRPPRDRTRALLAAAGFEGSLARALSVGATRSARTGNRELRQWLRQRVASRLVCRGGLLEGDGPQLIACVGPTGVGKTTTLAKLAAQATLTLGKSVRVISLDTFRVGALEQWRRYAELIGCPFDVVTNAGAFHRIVHSNPSDIVLVDTAGRSGSDQGSILGGCVNGLGAINRHVLLVLPAWMRARDAERVAQSYTKPGLTGVVITKLDETDQVGGVMHAPLGGKLPITYLCDGARVPEDIREAVLDDVLDTIFPEQA
ncbi:MAG: flagellar biosynthesis protein FlhF [Polyangiaceae bacterium]